MTYLLTFAYIGRMRDIEDARKRTQRAAALLLRDIVNPPSFLSLSAQVGLSRFELSRMLPAVMGHSGPELLRKARMEMAAELMRAQPGLRMGEVAAAVGYSSVSAFCRAFQREHHTLPGGYLGEKTPAAEKKADPVLRSVERGGDPTCPRIWRVLKTQRMWRIACVRRWNCS